MATTKSSKKSPAKRKTAATSTTSKKRSVRARPLTWRFYAVSIGIFFIAVATVVVIALFTAGIIAKEKHQARLERLDGIYASIGIDQQIHKQGKGAQITYLHGETVGNTVAELDKKIKAAGFTFVDEPQPGEASVQYHYQSSKGEYIRLIVISKPYEDAHQYATVMGKDVPDEVDAMDKNAGPARVTIKVDFKDDDR